MKARVTRTSPIYTDVESTLFRQSAAFLCNYQDIQWNCDIMYYPYTDSIIIQYGAKIADTIVIPVEQLRMMGDEELWLHDFRVPLLVALKMLYKAGTLKEAIYPLSIYDMVPDSALRLSCEPIMMLPC